MARLVQDADAPGRYDPWRVALVASYLLAGPQRRGVILRWRGDLTAEALGDAVTSPAEALGLTRPASRPAIDGRSAFGRAAPAAIMPPGGP